jgi:hypothetical protein
VEVRQQMEYVKIKFRIILVAIFCFVFVLIVSCGGSNSSNDNTNNGSSTVTPNEEETPAKTTTLETSLLKEIAYKEFEYKLGTSYKDYHKKMAMNSDASKVIIAFYNDYNLYTVLYANGVWGDPIWHSTHSSITTRNTIKLLMNERGEAVLVDYGEYRDGQEGTFSVSYFDGESWVYNDELEGTPYDLDDEVVCQLDDNGNFYIAYQNDELSPTFLKVMKFDAYGSEFLKNFYANDGCCILPDSLALNDQGKIMLLYHQNLGGHILFDSLENWIGYTAVYDGTIWVEYQNWTPDGFDKGILKYNNDGSAYLVYGQISTGKIKYQYFNNDFKEWQTIYDFSGLSGFYEYSDYFDECFELNDTGDKLMSIYQIDSKDFSDTFINYRLYSNFINNGVVSASQIFLSSYNPRLFYHSKGAFVSLFWDDWDQNVPMISYYYGNKWSEPEVITKDWIQPYFIMNKNGYLVFSTQYMVSICKLNDTLFN